MDTNYIIETKNLTKQYGSQKSVADLNIHVKRGRIYGAFSFGDLSGFPSLWREPLSFLPDFKLQG